MKKFAAFILLGGLLALPASAQTSPESLATDTSVTGKGQGCYALNTKPGETVTVAVQAGFKTRLKVGRGALCNAFTPQYDTERQVNFKAAGGRYIVTVAAVSSGEAGRFTLTASSGTGTGSGATTPGASPDEDKDAARKQLMAQQVQKRQADIAAVEARRQAEEAQRLANEAAQREQERQARQQAEQESRENMAAFMGALNSFATTYGNEMAKYDEEEAERAEMLRGFERQAEDAEDRRRLAEAETRQSQMPTPSPVRTATTSTPSGQTDDMALEAARLKAAQKARDDKAKADAMVQAKADAKARADADADAETKARILAEKAASRLIAMPEAVVVCPLAESYASICYGPFQNISQHHAKAEGMVLACGTASGGGAVRDLGYYGDFHVWGCQFGLNPEKTDSPNRDTADKFGLIVPARRTYRCDAEIHGYCRTM